MKLTNNLFFYPEKGILDCNTYVIKGDPGIIIDPGSRTFLPAMVQEMREDGIEPEDIGIVANTHLHGDHCGANEAFKELSGALINFHPVQKEFYDVTVIETARVFGLPAVMVKEDNCFGDGRLSVGELEFEFIRSPGHSPDSVCFYCEKERALICGDVIFLASVGRVDLPGGDAAQLVKTIEQLSQLDVEYVLPGHMGIISDVSKVKRNFEFIKENILEWF